MKRFALAAAVAAGLFCTAGTADAQFPARGEVRYANGTVVTYPTYVYGPTVYETYYPAYSGTVVQTGYWPSYSYGAYPGHSYSRSNSGFNTWNFNRFNTGNFRRGLRW